MAQNSAPCTGADLRTSVSVAGMTQEGELNVYHLAGTVTNVGKMKQAPNVLQFVEIYLDGTGRIDTRGIPPLKPGQNYAFGYDFKRSSDAGDGTSTLSFRISMRQPQTPTVQDCNPAAGITSVEI